MEENVPLNIKDERAHEAARELARARGTSITQAVKAAIMEALERERSGRRRDRKGLAAALDEIALHCANQPLIDSRSPDEILGYDERGVPG